MSPSTLLTHCGARLVTRDELQAVTAPPWRVVASTLVSVIEPTESTASAQRAFCKGFCGSGELVALDDLARA